ncbi:hypothetical protein NSA23_08510 [Anaerosalibacter massiliensis]|uniref:Uncharacterized protein n=1 Tax=Anaerosalibacter massiliensis TaxID=1347392 RepID=A0A9X2S543_9FIRM|nr:hypothetical protein [Anaerosalibacter massiliensis]MCR2044158.1 hypothetical protein [Anaerosalibacter massiliensis]
MTNLENILSFLTILLNFLIQLIKFENAKISKNSSKKKSSRRKRKA